VTVSQQTVQSTCSPSTVFSDLELPAQKRLGRYSTAEQKAILDHRFFLSISLQREASYEETLASWETGVCQAWRREKMRRDRHAQLKEIERHKYYLSMQCGHDIGWEPAAVDWIKNHAAAWREWWEHHWWEQQWWEQQSI